VFEFYPCAVDITAVATNFANDVRGKVCWISTTGAITFQNDQLGNTSGGYLPPAGCKLRMPNLFVTSVSNTNFLTTVQTCLSSWSANSLGLLIADKVMSHLGGQQLVSGLNYLVSNFHQVLNNVGFSPQNDTVVTNFNIGPVVASTVAAFAPNGSSAAAVFNNCKFAGYSPANSVLTFQTVNNMTFNYCHVLALKLRAGSSSTIRPYTCQNISFKTALCRA